MAALLLLVALSGDSHEIHDHFDMIEVNHFHNQYGAPVFVQLVLWDWYRTDARFHVQGWLMMHDAFDTSDAEHRREYQAELDRWLSQISNVSQRSHIRRHMAYKGKFVGGRLYPVRDHGAGYFRIRYYDAGVMRVITANLFRETYTTYDPEIDDRRYLPERARRGLSKKPMRREN